MSDTTTNDVNFLYEMGGIRYIDRMWRRFYNKDFANLAEHHFRVFWIAMVLASKEGGADTGKIAKLALLHDIAESRTGDVDYISRQYVERNEDMGISDMLEGTAIKEEFLALYHEYEERKTLEAKIVKDADNLDVDFELMEQAAHGVTLGKAIGHIRHDNVRDRYFTKSAQEIFDQLYKTDPHDWHVNGRNRHNAGDWKKEK